MAGAERTSPAGSPLQALPNDEAEVVYSEDDCLILLERAVEQEPGIIAANLDPRREVVSFSYRPEVVSEPQVEAIAQEVAASIQGRLSTCTLRFGTMEEHSCEACARAGEPARG